MSSTDYLDLCRLCLVKESAFVPIFDGEGDGRQIFHKIAACLPVKVTKDDKLPKKICNECVQKIELFYQFCNTTTNAEKQLLEWIGEVDLNDKQTYVSAVINQDQSSNTRLDGNVMQQTNEQHQNNIDMNMMESIGLEMPMMIQQNQTQMTINYTNNTNAQSMQSNTAAQQKNNNKNMEESDDDHCGGDDDMGQNEELSVKEEIQDTNRTIEPTFVSIPCEEAGPSGLQQKSNDIQDGQFLTGQSTDGDPKSGYFIPKLAMLSSSECNVNEMKVLVDGSTELIMITDGGGLHIPKIETMDDIVHNQQISSLIHCELCDEGFINEIELSQHVKSHESLQAHNIEMNIIKQTDIVNNDDFIDEEEVVEDNNGGGGGVVEKEDDNNDDDDDDDNDDDDDDDDDDFYNGDFDNNIDDDNENAIYVCEHCGRSFSTTTLLKNHQLQVHCSSPVNDNNKLNDCSSYTLLNNKQLNMEKQIGQEYNLNCDECNKIFYTRDSYEEHQQLHSSDKPFECNLCPATFRYRQGLRLHAKLHQPDYVPPQKKHLCELCNKRFSRKQVLLVHMRTHSNAGPQNEYVCHICNKSVSSKTYLTVHVRKHTGEKPHVCDLCNKAFISQNYLSVHRRTHTGERPHKCTHCEKRFTQRTTLVVHLRGHTGDRPYPCPYCYKSFASKTMLNSHLKTHAKQNARQQEQIPSELITSDQNLNSIQFEELQDDVIGHDELQNQSHTEGLDTIVLLPS